MEAADEPGVVIFGLIEGLGFGCGGGERFGGVGRRDGVAIGHVEAGEDMRNVD